MLLHAGGGWVGCWSEQVGMASDSHDLSLFLKNASHDRIVLFSFFLKLRIC